MLVVRYMITLQVVIEESNHQTTKNKHLGLTLSSMVVIPKNIMKQGCKVKQHLQMILRKLKENLASHSLSFRIVGHISSSLTEGKKAYYTLS